MFQCFLVCQDMSQKASAGLSPFIMRDVKFKITGKCWSSKSAISRLKPGQILSHLHDSLFQLKLKKSSFLFHSFPGILAEYYNLPLVCTAAQQEMQICCLLFVQQQRSTGAAFWWKQILTLLCPAVSFSPLSYCGTPTILSLILESEQLRSSSDTH